MHTGLDCWILSQNCRNILLWHRHTVAQVVSARNETLLWLAWMNYLKTDVNPDVRSCGKVKKRKWKLIYCCVLDASKAALYNGCDAGRLDYHTRR